MDRLKETFSAQLIGVAQACNEHQVALKKELRYISSY